MSVWFVHAWLAAAAAGAAAVPVLIHLWNRRRHREMPWAAMAFLQAALRRARRRVLLEQYALLLVRMAVVGLVGLALARPVVTAYGWAQGGWGQVHHVIVLDQTFSTHARVGAQGSAEEQSDAASGPPRAGRRVFDVLRERALRIVESAGPDDVVTVVPVSPPAAARQAREARRVAALVEWLEDLEPQAGGPDLTLAAQEVAAQMSASGISPESTQIYVLADASLNPSGGQRGGGAAQSAGESAQQRTPEQRRGGSAKGSEARASGMGGAGSGAAETADALRALRQAGRVVVSVAEGRSDNLAIEHLGVVDHFIVAGRVGTFEAVVVNHSSIPVTGLMLRVATAPGGGGALRIVPGDREVPQIGPGERRPVRFTVMFPEAGWHIVEARLIDEREDALPEDNVRRCVVRVLPEARVLLVDGKGWASRYGGETAFVRAALSPGPYAAGAPLVVETVLEGELSSLPLEGYGLIVLANVRALPSGVWERLRSFVAGGGGVVIFCGDLVDVDSYNASGLLPARLNGVVNREAGGGAAPVIRSDALAHPVMRVFRGYEESSLFRARVRQFVGIDEASLRAGDGRVVASLSSGEPLIVERRIGAGGVIAVLTSATLEWSELPAKGDFVSLMWSLLRYLWPDAAAGHTVVGGEILREPVTAEMFAQRLTMRAPGREPEPVLPVPQADRAAVVWSDTGRSGVYRLSAGSAVIPFVVNAAAEESDLSPVGESVWREVLGERVVWRAGEALSAGEGLLPAGSAGLDRFLLIGAVLLVVGESALAMWVGRTRDARGSPSGVRRRGGMGR